MGNSKKDSVSDRWAALHREMMSEVVRLVDEDNSPDSATGKAAVRKIVEEYDRRAKELGEQVMQEYRDFNDECIAKSREILSRGYQERCTDEEWNYADTLMDLALVFAGEFENPDAAKDPMVWYNLTVCHLSAAARLGLSPPESPQLAHQVVGRMNSAKSRRRKVADRDRAALRRIEYLRSNRVTIVEAKRTELKRPSWRYSVSFERNDVVAYLIERGLAPEGWQPGQRWYEGIVSKLPASLKLKKPKPKPRAKRR